MFLKLADKLVKQGDYAGALNLIVKAREQEPDNKYAIAYEERVRQLMHQSESKQPTPPQPGGAPSPIARTPFVGPARLFPDLPSVEGQFNAIATPMARPGQKPQRPSNESKDVAILTKISSLLGSANEYLGRKEYSRALEVISRAALLDPTNADIASIEKRIRSAQEEAVRRELEDRQHREAEERQRRDRDFRTEMDGVRREQERRRIQGEAARRSAQSEKTKEYLKRTRDFLAAGQIQEAQCELAFVSVVDPSNPQVIALEKEISARREERQRAELEDHRRQMEAQQRQEHAVRDSITEHVKKADELAARDEFGEALRLITRAYIVDPTNGDLQACENRIVNAQRAWTERTEEERRTNEEAQRRKTDEEELVRKDAEREKLFRAQKDQDEAKKRTDDQKIFRCMKSAHEHLARRHYEEALAEVATAFMIDPFHGDVKRMEQRIFEEQAKATGRPPSQKVTRISVDDEELTATIAKHLAEAKRLAERHHHAKALDEVSLALALDPSNVATRRIEATIKAEAEKERRDQAARNPLVTISQMAPSALRRVARSTVSQRAPASQLTSQRTPVQQNTARSQGRGLTGMEGIDQLIKAELQQTIPASDLLPERRMSKKPLVFGGAVLTGIAIITVLYFISTADATQSPTPTPEKHESVAPENANPPVLQPKERKTENAKGQSAPKGHDKTTETSEKSAHSTMLDDPSSSGGLTSGAPPVTEHGSSAKPQSTIETVSSTAGTNVEKSPLIIRMQQPKFPDGLVTPGVEEEVVVKVQINPRGTPVQATVTRSTNANLNESVIDAVMHSQYSPGVLATGPVTSWMTIPFTIKK